MEVHRRIRAGDADVGHVPEDVPGRDAECPAERHAQVGEVAAHAAAPLEDLERGRGGHALDAVRDVAVDPVAHGLHALHPRRGAAEELPRPVGHRVGLAEPAREQPVEQLVGERLDAVLHVVRTRHGIGVGRNRHQRVVRERGDSFRKQEAAAAVAVEVDEARRLDGRLGAPALGDDSARRVEMRLDQHDRRGGARCLVLEVAAQPQPHPSPSRPCCCCCGC